MIRLESTLIIWQQRSQLQSFGYTRVDPPFYLKDMHSQRRLALTAPGTTGLRLVMNNDNDNDNDKETAMKKAFRLQYEEAMKRQQEEKGEKRRVVEGEQEGE